MSEFFTQKAREHAEEQIKRRSKRVYTALDTEATEEIILKALEEGIIKSYKYHTYGYFIVEYN